MVYTTSALLAIAVFKSALVIATPLNAIKSSRDFDMPLVTERGAEILSERSEIADILSRVAVPAVKRSKVNDLINAKHRLASGFATALSNGRRHEDDLHFQRSTEEFFGRENHISINDLD